MASSKNAYPVVLWGSEIQSSPSVPVAATKHANINLSTGLGLPVFTAEWYISAFASKYVCAFVCVCVRTRNLLDVRADLFPALLTSHVLWLWTGPLKHTYPIPVHFGTYFLSYSKTPAISSKLPPKLRMYFYLYRKYTISKRSLQRVSKYIAVISKYKPRNLESHSERKSYTKYSPVTHMLS
jgi:hypothetical protein